MPSVPAQKCDIHGIFWANPTFSKNEKKVLTFWKCRCIIIYVVTATAADKGAEVVRIMWELSSAGRASALQAEGHRFEPCSSHQTY